MEIQNASKTQAERNAIHRYGGPYLAEFYRLLEEEYYSQVTPRKTLEDADDGGDNNRNKLFDVDWMYASRKTQYYELDEYCQLQICVATKISQYNKKRQLQTDGGYMPMSGIFVCGCRSHKKPHTKEMLARNIAEPGQCSSAFYDSELDDAACLELEDPATRYIDLRAMTFYGDIDEGELKKIDLNWMDHLNPNKEHKMHMNWRSLNGTNFWRSGEVTKRMKWMCEFCGNSVLPADWGTNSSLPSLTWAMYKQVILNHYTGCAGEQIAHLKLYQSALSKFEHNWFHGYFSSFCLTGIKGYLIAEHLARQNVSLVISSRQGGYRKIYFAPNPTFADDNE